MDDQRQRDEEPDNADPRYRIEADRALLAPRGKVVLVARSGTRLLACARVVIAGESPSTGHGVPVAMRDPPLTLLATVYLRGPQGVRARLAVDGG
jgi:hypothetical protein